MSDYPDNLRYTKEHEWARTESDGTVVVGITAHAVDVLGDITMVSLPKVGATLAAGQSFGDIDSVKAVSELYAPVGGTVRAVNEALADAPEKINEDPYGAGWMIVLADAKAADLAGLLSAADYAKFVAELDH